MISQSLKIACTAIKIPSACGPSLFKNCEVQVPLEMTPNDTSTSTQPGFEESWLTAPHKDFIIPRIDKLVEVTMGPPGAKKPGIWPPPSCTQYGLREVPNLVSDDVLAGLNFVLGSQALEWGEAHTCWPESWFW